MTYNPTSSFFASHMRARVKKASLPCRFVGALRMSLFFLGNRTYIFAYIKPTSNLQALTGITTRTRMTGGNRRASHPAHGLAGVKCPRLPRSTVCGAWPSSVARNCRLSPRAFANAARAPLFFVSGRGERVKCGGKIRGDLPHSEQGGGHGQWPQRRYLVAHETQETSRPLRTRSQANDRGRTRVLRVAQ